MGEKILDRPSLQEGVGFQILLEGERLDQREELMPTRPLSLQQLPQGMVASFLDPLLKIGAGGRRGWLASSRILHVPILLS